MDLYTHVRIIMGAIRLTPDRDDCMSASYEAAFALDAVTTVELVVSRWTTEAIAYALVGSGLGDGQYVAIAIETSRRHVQHYSLYAGFLLLYDLVSPTNGI